MRAGCVIAILGWLASLVAAAEQEFPYTAYIARREAALRGGPGRNYYTTDKLPGGETVEVYRHDGDWCAIRPPVGSFSWVRAEDLRIDREGIGIVLVEDAASRIGSNTNEFRDVIQVRLQRGEQVEVLDAVQVSNDNGVEFYCKIAPPSGEFRWVHKDDISRDEPDPELYSEEDAAPPPGRIDEPAEHLQPTKRVETEHRSASDRWGSWVRSRRSDRPGEAGTVADVRADDSRDSDRSRSIALASSDETERPSAVKGSNVRPSGRASTGITEAEQIDRELSRIVVAEPSEWKLDTVRKRTGDALHQASTESDRHKLRELQDRIARFDDIRRRSMALESPEHVAESLRDSIPTADRESLPSSPSRVADNQSTPSRLDHVGEPAAADSQPRLGETRPREYDGVGKLTRVVSQRPGAPRYALVNRDDEVVTFVSPAPGVNLRSYEGEYVGISGQRGYMPELKKSHVTALRIKPLESAPSHIARRR